MIVPSGCVRHAESYVSDEGDDPLGEKEGKASCVCHPPAGNEKTLRVPESMSVCVCMYVYVCMCVCIHLYV